MTHVETINAITFVATDMAASVDFYEAFGFEVVFGGPSRPFTTLSAGACFVNLTSEGAEDHLRQFWGRVIFHVDDVDALYRQVVAAGLSPRAAPRDAPWGERMFPIDDPDGNDLSFARRLG
jgi:catechol 2,3-dioxygenase-like lactoylglutathione lyase family enzyme